MNVVFTICSNNYLSQALSLRESLKSTQKDIVLYIILADKKQDFYDDDLIIEVANIGIDMLVFETLLNEYNIIEFNTAIKPFAFYFLMQQKAASKIIYLDPDILVYHSLSTVWGELEENDFILTPHLLKPVENIELYHLLLGCINTGVYNLGFLAIRVNEVTKSFINWWKKHLTSFGHNDILNGQFYDQKVMNLLPAFFENVKISRHSGRNVAEWNLHERDLVFKDGSYYSNNVLLEFFHFSGVKISTYSQNILNNKLLEKSQSAVLKSLIEKYIEMNIHFRYKERINTPCYYQLQPNIHRASRKEIYLYKLKKWLTLKK